MRQLYNMEIAGVNFTLNGDESVHLHDSKPAYHSFTHEGCHMNPFAGIDIVLKIRDKIPGTNGLDQIFDSGNAWSMYRDGEGYCISLELPGYEEPIWLAKVNQEFTQATLFCSRELVMRDNEELHVSNPMTYPLDQILLMYILAQRKGLLVHAMGFISEQKGYLFPGRSGAGKSTMAHGLLQRKGFELLSDDRLVVRKSDGKFRLYGTPWPGDAGIALNRSVDLSAIFFLEHDSINRIEALGKGEAVERLLSVISVPWYEKDVLLHILASCGELLNQVPAYRLRFKPGIEVTNLLDRFIKPS